MKLNVTILLIAAALAQPGHAIPIVHAVGCTQDGLHDPYKNLRQLANIVESDDRHPLSQVAQSMGFSKVEVEQAMACTGDVVCRAGVQSAFSALRSNILVTARHLFIDKDGNKKSALDSCYFSSFSKPTEKIPLVISTARELDSGGNPHQNVTQDYVAVNLASPIPGCKPYPVDETNTQVRPGDQLIVLSGENFHSRPNGTPNEPAAQTCAVRKIFDGETTVFHSDCDSLPGLSGSVNLQRIDGHLVAKGIIRGSGGPELDGQPYDEGIGSRAQSLALDGIFLKSVLSH